jgi:hypothetical protein
MQGGYNRALAMKRLYSGVQSASGGSVPAGGGGVTRTGNWAIIDASADISQAITVPADTDIIIIAAVGGWDLNQIGNSCTIGGSACTREVLVQYAETYDLASIWYKAGPATGTPTLAINFTSNAAFGGQVYYACYKGGSTITDNGSNSTSDVTVNTGELTASSGDAVFAVGVADWLPETASWTNATELNETADVVNHSLAEAFPSGAVTITVSSAGTGPCGIAAVVIGAD